jgi:hypothetical protein
VPSSHLPEVRQDHLGWLRPARQAGAGRSPGIPALRRPCPGPGRQRRLAAQAHRPQLNRRQDTPVARAVAFHGLCGQPAVERTHATVPACHPVDAVPHAGALPEGTASRPVRLGLRANLAQFLLLVTVNALVGGTLGQERTVVPLLATQTFPPRSDRQRADLHPRLRRGQGGHQLLRRRPVRPARPQARAHRRLAGRHPHPGAAERCNCAVHRPLSAACGCDYGAG